MLSIEYFKPFLKTKTKCQQIANLWLQGAQNCTFKEETASRSTQE
jgi:hypothetical protein